MTRWTEQDKQLARAMWNNGNGALLREIAAALPGERTAYQVGNMLNPKRGTPKFDKGIQRILAMLGAGNEAPPKYIVAEAFMRAVFPRTTTMEICGDPVLNQSELYRREYGERL